MTQRFVHRPCGSSYTRGTSTRMACCTGWAPVRANCRPAMLSGSETCHESLRLSAWTRLSLLCMDDVITNLCNGCTGGAERRRRPYRNPAKDGLVGVVASHGVSKSTAHWMFVGRSNARAYIDCRHPGTWLAIDLRRHALRPTRYSLRAGPVDAEAFRLRNWQLQGSSDGMEWVASTKRLLLGH